MSNDRVLPSGVWELRFQDFRTALDGVPPEHLETVRILIGAELGDRWKYDSDEEAKRRQLIEPLWERFRYLLTAERERDDLRDALHVLTRLRS